MKDLDFNSDTETYTPIGQFLKYHKDDINTEYRRKKVGKVNRLKIARIKNLISKTFNTSRVLKHSMPKHTNHKRLCPFLADQVHAFDSNIRTRNMNDSTIERITWHDAISSCKSFNNLEIENVDIASFGSKKKSIDEVASQVRKLHF